MTAAMLAMTGCRSLDMDPLAAGSSDNWFSSKEEFVMALNDLYRPAIWYWEGNRRFHTDRWTDDWNQRETHYEWPMGTLNSETGYVGTTWSNCYKGITRANTILRNVREQRGAGRFDESDLDQYEGEASFFRACLYSYLIFLYGDAPFYTDYISLDDAFALTRTDKNIILGHVYDDFDRAVELLPETPQDLKRATKGAAYAFKARTAIWMLDWATAAQAAKDCMDMDVYSLHEDFGDLFVSKTRSSSELIFTLPRSKELISSDATGVSAMLPCNVGGTNTAQPSWELLCAFLCTDGKPITESPLYDPSNPFRNRDPRLAETMVEFGSVFLGYVYDPSVKETLNVSTGKMISNRDSQLVNQHAAWNGLCLKKTVDEEHLDMDSDPSVNIMRYGDVLLMYAEAKIELNQIDASVLEAINLLRARAYKADIAETSKYPAVTETDQTKLRTILRMERRMELAWENRRWFDLVRWRLAEIAITRPMYALPQTTGVQTLVDKGYYFFPKDAQYQPTIDENGLVDLSPIYASGQYRISIQRNFQKRQYLLPIPSEDVMIAGLEQNDGY